MAILLFIIGLYLYQRNFKSYAFIPLALASICIIALYPLIKRLKNVKDDEESKWILLFREVFEKDIKTKEALLELDLPIELRLLLEKAITKEVEREEYISLLSNYPMPFKIAIESLYFLLEKNSMQEWNFAYGNLMKYQEEKIASQNNKSNQLLSALNTAIFILFMGFVILLVFSFMRNK